MKTESMELECAILYAIFKYDGGFSQVLKAGIKPAHFSNPVHRLIFRVVADDNAANKTVMSVSGFYKYYLAMPEVTDEDAAKVKAALSNLKNSGIAQKDVENCCKQVVKLYAIRKYLKGINDSIDNIEKDGVDSVIADVEEKLSEIKKDLNPNIKHTVMGLKTGLEERIELAKEIKNNPNKAGLIETGFINFDKFLPKQTPGQLIIYQARNNMGKSMFLMGTALHNHRRGMKVIVITIEMSEKDYCFRMDSNVTKIEHSEFAKGTVTDSPHYVKKWADDIGEVSKAKEDLLVYWVPTQCTSKKICDIIENNPFKPDLVVVDYAGDMKSGLKGVADYDPKAHGQIYADLKEIAGTYNNVLYTAQQTKRGVKKITSEDGSWSDVASNKADIMIAIECTKEDEEHLEQKDGIIYKGRLTLTIIKGRNIPKCKTHIIPDFQRMRWLEKEMDEMLHADFVAKETDKKKTEKKAEKIEKEMENTKEQSQSEHIPPKQDDSLASLIVDY